MRRQRDNHSDWATFSSRKKVRELTMRKALALGIDALTPDERREMDARGRCSVRVRRRGDSRCWRIGDGGGMD